MFDAVDYGDSMSRNYDCNDVDLIVTVGFDSVALRPGKKGYVQILEFTADNWTGAFTLQRID